MKNMEKIILVEFMKGTGICGPDGHVYKDTMVSSVKNEVRLLLDIYLITQATPLKEIIRCFKKRNWLQDN